jgi:hypothetical protein
MTSPDPDRLRYAQIAGAVARHALGWRLTAAEEAVAVAELTEAAAGRADLLAERAGTALGFGEGRPDAARYRQIAELCIAAGADQALIERWIKVGRDRAAAAVSIPYTGLPPSGLLLLVAGFDEGGRGPADVLRVADRSAGSRRGVRHTAQRAVLEPRGLRRELPGPRGTGRQHRHQHLTAEPRSAPHVTDSRPTSPQFLARTRPLPEVPGERA